MYYPKKREITDCDSKIRSIIEEMEKIRSEAFYDGYITSKLETPEELRSLDQKRKIELCLEAQLKAKYLNEQL